MVKRELNRQELRTLVWLDEVMAGEATKSQYTTRFHSTPKEMREEALRVLQDRGLISVKQKILIRGRGMDPTIIRLTSDEWKEAI